jgi:transcriptional regulator with XRE-family HTH domain
MPQIDPKNARKVVGDRLRLAREAMRKTIKDIAIEAGMDSRTLQEIEDGNVDFRILTLQKLCKGYKVSADHLLDDLIAPKNSLIGKKKLHQK